MKHIFKYHLLRLIVLITLIPSGAISQDHKVNVILSDPLDESSMKILDQQPKSIDLAIIPEYVDSLRSMLFSRGYLSCGLDSLVTRNDTVFIYLYSGPTYSLMDISIGENDALLLQGSDINYIDLSGRVLTQKVFDDFRRALLRQLANSGYPFASVSLDSINIDGRSITSKLKVDKNELILYDSIMITGDADVNKSFLHKYLNIRKGFPYRHDDVLEIKQRVTDLQYMDFKADPTISFVNEKAYFNLPLVNRNASSFDFIIGILPRTENGIRKWTITGDFSGEFINKLGSGESMAIRYRRLKPETQELDMELDYPYIFGLPFGVDANFELYRNTSEFLDLQTGFGISYNLSRRNHMKIGWNFSSSRLIDVDTLSVLNSGRLPPQLDINFTAGKVSLVIDRLNSKFNPRSGFKFRIQAEAGQKKILPNLSITSLSNDKTDFATAYDSLRLNTFQSRLFLDIDYFINIRDWATFRVSNRVGYKYNQRKLFRNEYFRIGGNKLLRGFNEQSIFTPFYSVFTGEFRILLDQYSFISLPFLDWGILHTDNDEGLGWETAAGLGIALNFATQVGIFNIAFAAGAVDGIGFDFGDTKIHFGFVNLF